jgi:hypothetical protein
MANPSKLKTLGQRCVQSLALALSAGCESIVKNVLSRSAIYWQVLLLETALAVGQTWP